MAESDFHKSATPREESRPCYRLETGCYLTLGAVGAAAISPALSSKAARASVIAVSRLAFAASPFLHV